MNLAIYKVAIQIPTYAKEEKITTNISNEYFLIPTLLHVLLLHLGVVVMLLKRLLLPLLLLFHLLDPSKGFKVKENTSQLKKLFLKAKTP